jgi:hypothetical protein
MAVVLLGAALVTVVLRIVVPGVVRRPDALFALALAALLAAGALIAFVLRADPYVADGRSRWQFHEGGPHTLFWAALALDLAAVVALTVAGINQSRTAGNAGVALLVGALVTACASAIGFSAN